MESEEIIPISNRKRTFIFINLIVSGIATSILSTAMTTALSSLVEYFGVSTSIGQWATSGYSLAMGMVMPLTVGIMTVVSAGSVETYGDKALMHGMNMSFLWMAVGSFVLLLISILGTKDSTNHL